MTNRQKALDIGIFNIVKTDPWYPIRFTENGTEYRLEFGYKEIKDIYRVTGRNAFAEAVSISDLTDPDLLFKVLLIGLHYHQPELTEEQLEALIKIRYRLYYATCVARALEATEPDYALIDEKLKEIQTKEAEGLPTELPLGVTLP